MYFHSFPNRLLLLLLLLLLYYVILLLIYSNFLNHYDFDKNLNCWLYYYHINHAASVCTMATAHGDDQSTAVYDRRHYCRGGLFV